MNYKLKVDHMTHGSSSGQKRQLWNTDFNQYTADMLKVKDKTILCSLNYFNPYIKSMTRCDLFCVPYGVLNEPGRSVAPFLMRLSYFVYSLHCMHQDGGIQQQVPVTLSEARFMNH